MWRSSKSTAASRRSVLANPHGPERIFGPETLVLLPIGAAAEEHGPHLRLDNDERLADGYARLVGEVVDVVIAPTLDHVQQLLSAIVAEIEA